MVILYLLVLFLFIPAQGRTVPGCTSGLLTPENFIRLRGEFKVPFGRTAYRPGGINSSDINYPLPQCRYAFAQCKSTTNAKTSCLNPIKLCDGNIDCAGSKDQHKCEEAVSFFRKDPGKKQRIGAQPNFDSFVRFVDEKVCAKICLETENCQAFAFSRFDFTCDIYTDPQDTGLMRAEGWDHYRLKCADQCKTNQYQCSPKECIPLEWMCDGEDDCSNRRDELFCDVAATYFSENTKPAVAKHYKMFNKITYGGCAFKCFQEPDSCTSFWYSALDKKCGLNCDFLFGCPSTRSLTSSSRYRYYRPDVLSTLQALKYGMKKMDKLLSLEMESGDVNIPTSSSYPPCYETFGRSLNIVKDTCGISEVSEETEKIEESEKRPSTDQVFSTENVKPADRATYPWQVHIRKLIGNSWTHHCGGAILTEYHILTAAHCMQEAPNKLQIIVGQKLTTSSFELEEQIFEVQDLESHTKYFQYDPKHSNQYDIGVITIKPSRITSKGIQFGKYVKPVCLPCSDMDVKDFEFCQVSGFGLTFDPATNSEVLSKRLLAAPMQILPQRECREFFNKERYPIEQEVFCAGGGKASVCSGDSGGPLVCERNGRFILMGVVHSGTQKCDDSPALFQRVKVFLSFINKEIGAK